MIHSIWQTALLLLIFMLTNRLWNGVSPLLKRNTLYVLLTVQLLISFFTFFIIDQAAFRQLLPELSFSFQHSLQNTFVQKYAPFIYLIYLIVFVYRVVNAFFKWNHFKVDYKKSLIKPSIDLRLFTQTKIYQLGIHRKVSIWCSQHISSPMTFGFWKPIILLPVALVNKLSMEETETLILHELTHIRNHDYILNWLLLSVETLYFFNPFVRIMAQKIKTEREKNCDLQVLQFNFGTILYAEALHKTAQYQQIQLSHQLAAVQNKKQLLERICYFSNPKNLCFKNSTRFIYASVLLVMLLVNGMLAPMLIQQQTIKNNVADFVQNAPSTFTKEHVSLNALSGKVFTAANKTTAYHKTEGKRVNRRAVSTKATNEVKVTEENISIEAPVFYAMAAANEYIIEEGKEILINDVSSDGKKITAAYRALLINGVWTLQPIWMLQSETKAIKDSLKQKVKDAVIHIYPGIQ